MPVLESLLSIEQAAKLVGISSRTLRRMTEAGDAPRLVRVGRSIRFRASDLDRWIRAGCPVWAEIEEDVK